jgi:hypothetical protein
MEHMLLASRERDIPMIITGAGGNGTRNQLEWTLDIVREIAREKGLKFTLASIDAELDKEYLKEKLNEGKIKRLDHPKDLTEEDIERSTTITAMMGPEPIIKALDQGADVVIAGRCIDDATFAAIPIREGFDPGLAFHLGKIMECSCLACVPRSGAETIIGTLREDHFLVEPANPNRVCTVESVASHTLYEREDPYIQLGPGGYSDLTKVKFEQYDKRTVMVTGSKWVKDPVYKVKLEGAAPVGYRVLCIAGVRDPILINDVDGLLEHTRNFVRRRFPKENYHLIFHVYGRNAIMKDLEPQTKITSNEIGIVTEVVANEQKMAIEICELAQRGLWGYTYKGQLATAGNVAFLYSMDVYIPQNAMMYEWSLDHLLTLDDPCECFPIKIEEVRGW